MVTATIYCEMTPLLLDLTAAMLRFLKAVCCCTRKAILKSQNFESTGRYLLLISIAITSFAVVGSKNPCCAKVPSQ